MAKEKTIELAQARRWADKIAIDLMDDAEAACMQRDRLHLHDIANRAMMLWWQEWRMPND